MVAVTTALCADRAAAAAPASRPHVAEMAGRLVQRLANDGRIVIYCSHVLEIVEQVATDVLILHDGHVVAHDSVSRLRELMMLSSLEEVFKNLVIATDLDSVAADLVSVMRV